jgi:diguanylate cyclase (GGDEF)-like protein
MYKLKLPKPESMPVIASVLACLFWFIDSAIDTFIFNTQSLYVESLLEPGRFELWTRCQVILLLMAFSLFAMLILRRHRKTKNMLNQYKERLEHLVDERMNDLSIKNTILKAEIIEHQKIEAKLSHLATIDPLTLIANRRKFDDMLRYELNRDTRYNNGLSLIFCDLDYFKSINDIHGHKIGDEVLKEFTQLVSSHIRKTDIFARWGGEEFVLLLPDTNISKAINMAEKLRKETELYDFTYVENITASFGVTQFNANDSETTFINRADKALYKSKQRGRNRVEVIQLNTPCHTYSLA